MNIIDGFILEIGHAVLGFCLIFLIIWILSHSPFLAWIGKIGLLLLWGLGSAGAVLFVVLGIYIPKGQYITALITLVVGGVIYVPWFIIGVPELKKTLERSNWTLRIWE
jgi:hypothetical protein